jgi:hypothetical protein
MTGFIGATPSHKGLKLKSPRAPREFIREVAKAL